VLTDRLRATTQVLFSPDGSCLYSVDSCGGVCVFDTTSGYQPAALVDPTSLLGCALRLSVSPDGGHLAATTVVGEGGAAAVVLDARSLRPLLRLEVDEPCAAAAFASDSRHVLVATVARVLAFPLAKALPLDLDYGPAASAAAAASVLPARRRAVPVPSAGGRTVLRHAWPVASAELFIAPGTILRMHNS